jgi:hypothetical protein
MTHQLLTAAVATPQHMRQATFSATSQRYWDGAFVQRPTEAKQFIHLDDQPLFP